MPAPLNRVAYGLLDYFGIKAGEWGPRELGQLLSPTIDLSRWYLDQYALEVGCTISGAPWAANTADGFSAITATSPFDLTTGGVLVVPQDEVWYILEADTRITMGVDAGIFADGWLTCSVTSSGISGLQPLPMIPMGFTQGTAVAGVTRSGVRVLERPFWAVPGAQINFFRAGFSIPAGTVSASARLRLQRMRR